MAKKREIGERFGNILDYVHWRGDLSFLNDPLNEIDGLVLATVAYSNFGENSFHFDSNKSISLIDTDIEALFSTLHQEQMILAGDSQKMLLEAMANSRRFCNMQILDQVNDVDPKRNIQFSAAAFHFHDVGTIIAFRGTDSSLVGWKEDFMMGYETPVPAQLSALNYLQTTANKTSGALYIVGHSKGGNLALYSASHAGKDIQNRISAVYSFDGPGLDDDTMGSEGYNQISDRICSFVPKESVVGLLLNYYPNYQVVDSTQTSIMQHQPFTWKLLGNKFLTSEMVSQEAQLLDQSMHEWLKSCTAEQRELVVTALFTMLEHIQNSEISVDQIRNEISQTKIDKNSAKKVFDLLYRLMAIYAGNTFGEKVRKPLAMAAEELRWRIRNGQKSGIESEIMRIDNRGVGFSEALEETERIAELTGLSHKNTIRLRLLAEELLSMLRNVTEEWNATFRILCSDGSYQLILASNIRMDRGKRAWLKTISSEVNSNGSFQNKLRSDLKKVIMLDEDTEIVEPSAKEADNNSGREGFLLFEQSVLYRLADKIRISTHGGMVFLAVSRKF